ncbi:hypothetical protein BGW80DRAFT_1253224 [Lactifluus volemus]|nr:hypothetical protein BGW80DRAFT_1253224 [Lactifluus volemus]
MVPSALSKIPPYKEITDVPSLIDMELEIVAQIELNDDNKGSDPGDNSDLNDNRSLLNQHINFDMDYVLPIGYGQTSIRSKISKWLYKRRLTPNHSKDLKI